ncbi:MAG: GNAT family N-acetyltransferase [Oscillospiraceae bacterium]|jgi:predicted acetyltransferase|nr:GNAT family N-acetyltransferase [Oscillospiraceae bacterium]
MIILDKSRWDDSRRLTQYCFRDNSEEFTRWYYDRRASRVFALLDERGGIIAQAVDSRARIRVRGVDLPSSVISHVATDPGYRSKGIMRGLLTDALRALYDEGAALAALYPSAYSFYERYGFAACGDAVRVSIAPDRLKAAPLSDRLSWDCDPDIDQLTDCYAAAHADISGSLTRDAGDTRDRVDDMVRDGASVVALRRGGIVTGYWFRRDDSGVMIINEAVFRDASARVDFLSYIAQHASTVVEARILIPAFDPLLRMLPDRHASVKLEPWGMFRAVNLRALANGLPAGEGCVTLNIIDEQIEDNNGLWRFEACGGRLRASRADGDGSTRVSALSIRSAASWLMGSADGSSLMETGSPITPETARAMDRLLPARRVFIWEQY